MRELKLYAEVPKVRRINANTGNVRHDREP